MSRKRTFLACLVLSALLGSGCGAERMQAAKQSDIQLPALGDYASVALSADGALWVTDTYGAILRVEPTGAVTEFELPGSPQFELDFPQDIVEGPDGAMWFSTTQTLGRIDAKGSITASDIRHMLPGPLIAGDRGFWYAADVEGRDHLEHVDANGVVTESLRLPSGPFDPFTIEGISLGPGDAIWFTQSSHAHGKVPDAVARVSRDGRYESWPLPHARSGPIAIAAGADGALWFTEEQGRRIGRITTSGSMREYPLSPEVSPTDILAGRDDDLWFSSDTCIGRITTGGDITMWPVAGALKLVDIEAAPDGSFWLLDSVGHALRHFTAPQGRAAVAGKPCRPPGVVAKAGLTRAALTYRRLDHGPSSGDFFTDIRVRIARGGKGVFSEAVPFEAPHGDPQYTVVGYSEDFAVRDLDADGEPEVILELNWNGTHCCEWSRIYRFEPLRETYVPATHFWGNALASPKLEDVDDDGRPEFLSKDDRFAQLTGYAGVVAPIQIWSYDRGEFSDVTRHYPNLITEDTQRLWRLYLSARGKRNVRYLLAAWAAEQYMLDRAATVDRTLGQALARGDLNRDVYDGVDAADYLRKLKDFLRQTGYVRE